MTGQVRDLYWLSLEDPGFEQLHIEISDSEINVLGFILRKLDEKHLRIRYEMALHPGWQFRRLSLAASECGGQAPKRLLLERDAAGGWTQDGLPIELLQGCRDVDIQVTPFTNSLPIHRLALQPGDGREIEVAYVALPTLAPRKEIQRYRCLEGLGPAGGLFRYESPASGFAAELAVDGDGLVLDYPELFQRSWPR